MKRLPWKTLIRILGLAAALWALFDIIRRHLAAF
jgi:hypothetical protein